SLIQGGYQVRLILQPFQTLCNIHLRECAEEGDFRDDFGLVLQSNRLVSSGPGQSAEDLLGLAGEKGHLNPGLRLFRRQLRDPSGTGQQTVRYYSAGVGSGMS